MGGSQQRERRPQGQTKTTNRQLHFVSSGKRFMTKIYCLLLSCLVLSCHALLSLFFFSLFSLLYSSFLFSSLLFSPLRSILILSLFFASLLFFPLGSLLILSLLSSSLLISSLRVSSSLLYFSLAGTGGIEPPTTFVVPPRGVPHFFCFLFSFTLFCCFPFSFFAHPMVLQLL